MLLAASAASVAFVALLGAGCGDPELSSAPSGGDVDVGRLPRSTPATRVPSDVDADDTTDVVGTTEAELTTEVTTGETVSTDDPGAASVPPQVPAAGVPGVGDPDPVCRSWSQIIGTRQVLTLAANFGDVSAADLGRLEVIAAPLVQRATLEFAGALIDVDDGAVAAERDDVLDDLLGPLGRRASRAVAALAAVGAGRDEEFLFAQVWLDGLGRFGAKDVVPTLADLGPELGPMVDEATARFLDDVAPWTDDTTLDTSDVEAPATRAWLADRCPDLSALGVGDAV